MNEKSISGYTTTYNCFEMQYPFTECIRSLLGFCDDVVVADAGSTDGTLEALQRIARMESRLRIIVEPVDFSHPRWALYQDGYLKAKARARCEGEYCWQTDTDEVVAEDDYWRVRQLPLRMGAIPLIMLPMIEFWGSFDYVRGDFFSWKPRFSINDKRITHGIPRELRCYDAHGHEYPRPFDSDSCNYIYRDTGEGVPIVIPTLPEERHFSQLTDAQFERFYLRCLDLYPAAFHISWLSLKRKVAHYRKFWAKFHASMYNLQIDDRAETNVMFDKPWSAVSDTDIEAKARELEIIGPRFFHHKMNPLARGRTVRFKRTVPQALVSWHAAQEQRDQDRPVVPHLSCHPRVTLVVTSHNRGPRLNETLESIAAQSYPHVETIVVNDGSSDQTAEIARAAAKLLRSAGIRCYDQAYRGSAEAANFGVNYANSEYVGILQAGDRIAPNYLAEAATAIGNSAAHLFFSAAAGPDGVIDPATVQQFNSREVRFKKIVPNFALLAREYWRRGRLLRPGLDPVALWDLWIRIAVDEPRIATLTQPLFFGAQPARETERWIELLKVANDPLYTVDEVAAAHASIAAEAGFTSEELRQLIMVAPHQWVLIFAHGLMAEARGDKDLALKSYVDAINMTAERSWQPIYRTAALVYRGGKTREAENLFYTVRSLRADAERLPIAEPYASAPRALSF